MVGAIRRWWDGRHARRHAADRELIAWLQSRGAHKVDYRRGGTRICVYFMVGMGYEYGGGYSAHPGTGSDFKAKDATTGKAQDPDGETDSEEFSEAELHAASG